MRERERERERGGVSQCAIHVYNDHNQDEQLSLVVLANHRLLPHPLT